MTSDRLPIAIEHALSNGALVDFRKEPSKMGVQTPPTKSEDDAVSKVKDFVLKSVNPPPQFCLPKAFRRSSRNLLGI
jgi:hypothetical protein